jgi:hypothetical protein
MTGPERARKSVIMQNKPNFPKAKMEARSIITKAYEKNGVWAVQENKAKQSQF